MGLLGRWGYRFVLLGGGSDQTLKTEFSSGESDRLACQQAVAGSARTGLCRQQRPCVPTAQAPPTLRADRAPRPRAVTLGASLFRPAALRAPSCSAVNFQAGRN